MEIVIDGKTCACESGEFLLDIALRNGIDIPTLCHHEGLSGQGCCRVCLAEVVEGGRSKIVVSCVYPVERECTVHTASDAVRENRAVVLMLLKQRASNSPEIDAMFQKYGGMETGRFTTDSAEKCILCGLCTRACEALGSGAITTARRGIVKEVATPFDEALECVGCASCAGVCPTGAIELSQDEQTRTIWGRTFQLAHCEACGAAIGTEEELAFAAQKSGLEKSPLCEACRQKGVSDVLAKTFGLA